MAAILVLLSVSLLGFSLLVYLSGTALAVPTTLAVLTLWGIAGFALNPLQQYRVAGLAPRTRNVALSPNACAIYLGQGAGSLGTLGWTGSLCVLAALTLLLLTVGTKGPEVAPEG
jgi:predicted MFS family arabinose efflux permease